MEGRLLPSGMRPSPRGSRLAGPARNGGGGKDLPPDLLRAFIAVADLGGFTRAARVLHRTQSIEAVAVGS